MDAQPSSETPQARTRLTLQRGNFYFGLGFALLAGLVVVVGLGAFGITGLGVFTASTAFAMTGIAITLVAAVSFVTLVTLRRTLELLSHHESALVDQAARHADLAAKVQSQWRAEQVLRDRTQDDGIAALSARQDVAFVAGRRAADRTGARAARSAVVVADPFQGGQVHPTIDVEGIGEHYGRELAGIGIKDTRQLWNADTTYVAGALKVAPAAVEGWQCMAELMAVSGVGKQYAELLVRADVSSIDELCAETPQALLARIHRLEKHQGNRIQGNTIGVKAVQGWIGAAQAHHGIVPVVKAGA
jgi:membrane protein implicated in regulation of membrane protease activity